MVRGCEFEYSTIESEKGDWMDDLKNKKTGKSRKKETDRERESS